MVEFRSYLDARDVVDDEYTFPHQQDLSELWVLQSGQIASPLSDLGALALSALLSSTSPRLPHTKQPSVHQVFAESTPPEVISERIDPSLDL